jgi:dihydroorotate dehydrogenase electron transfer subunit
MHGNFLKTEPGHFIQIGCRPPGNEPLLDHSFTCHPGEKPNLQQPELCSPLALLRRPFSLSGRGDGWIEIIHRVVGVGTQWLAQLNPGDPVDFIGPLGNTFTLPSEKSLGLLVGGGVGLPPMFYLAQAMHQARWEATAFVGAQTRDLLAITLQDDQAAEFSQFNFNTIITTDDGSFGQKGFITDSLKLTLDKLTNPTQTVIDTCGPNPMMHAVAKLAAQYQIDCQVCLEQAMACGMSTCQSCIVKIENPPNAPAHLQPHGTTPDNRPWCYRLACTDGPVFNAKNVIWQ